MVSRVYKSLQRIILNVLSIQKFTKWGSGNQIKAINKSKRNFKDPFHGKGWTRGWTASRLQSHYELSLLLTTKSPEIPGTNLLNLVKMKDWLDIGAT